MPSNSDSRSTPAGSSGSPPQPPRVGQVWQRKPPGKQQLRVSRVWTAGVGLFPDDPTVAGHTVCSLEPLNGGQSIISTVPELHENAELIEGAP